MKEHRRIKAAVIQVWMRYIRHYLTELSSKVDTMRLKINEVQQWENCFQKII
jgi:hypothetical protein